MNGNEVRRSVWNGLLGAERQVRYYTKLFNKHNTLQSRVDNALAISGSLAIASLVAKVWPDAPAIPEAPAVLGGIAAVLSVYSRIAKHASKAARLDSIRVECVALLNQFEALWARVQSDLVEDEEALERVYELQSSLSSATDKAALIGISVDDGANKAAWTAAIQAKEGQYAET